MEKSLWQKVQGVRAVLIAPLVLFSLIRQGNAQEGGEPGAYLRPPVGAAAVALGGAYTAAPGQYMAWWNPAALGFLRELHVAGGSGIRSMGRVDVFGTCEFQVPPRVGMGLLVLYRGDPSIDLYGTDDRRLPTSAYTTMTIKGALGYYVNRRLSAGACMSVLYQSLPNFGGDDGISSVSATGIGAIDLSLHYRMAHGWTVAMIVKNLGARMEWQMGDYAPQVSDRPIPEFVAASSWTTALAEKPFVWFVDCKGYMFDGDWNMLFRPEAVLCTGAEWRRWDNFFVRAGIGDIELDRRIINSQKRYAKESSFQVSAGFSYDLARVRKGLWLNYGVATDKIWAGIDQQLDVTYRF